MGQTLSPSLRLALVITAFGVLVLGFFPGLIAEAGDVAKTVASGF